MKILQIIPLMLTVLALAGLAQAATLIDGAEPRAVLVLPDDPHEDETLAAEEIREHLELMSGAALDIVSAGEAPEDLVPVYIGDAADAALEDAVRAVNEDPHAFALHVSDDAISIRGLSPRGTLHGAYELLEQLGVRWYHPGDLGRVVPESQSVTLDAQETVQGPSFAGRTLQAVGNAQWAGRMRLGGKSVAGSHGIPGISHDDFEEHPEFFGLVNGERQPRQICLSNPEVLERALASARQSFRDNPDLEILQSGPNDGGGFCECEDCKALDGGDWDPFFNEISVTDRYVWFFNQMLEGLEDEFPDAKVGFYIYHTYQRPPVKHEAHRGIRGSVAPIGMCRVHGPNNPICPEQHQYTWLIEEWGKVLPEVFERGYWFNLACPGLPFVMVHRLREQVPLAHELGLTRWRVEVMPKWASENPSLYIASKLMWDHTADVDALLDDFFANYFGPAAEPMEEYIMMLDAALRDADYHTGSSWDMHNFYPADLRSHGRTLLEQAEQNADGVYQTRVEIVRKALDFLDAFIEMREHATAHRYVEAQQALDRVDAIIGDLNTSYEIPMLNARFTPAYLRRFFRQPVEQAYARVTDGNEFIAGLEDEWQFMMDPPSLGTEIGLHLPDTVGGNWQPILASESWGSQGLRYYKGHAWYRQTVEIPEEYADGRVFLWFGGADELAAVWLNGEPLGASHGSSFLPFEMDATDAIQPGENVLAIRATNIRLSELGTGGLTGPVMFYAPAGGDEAELDNLRDIRRLLPGGAVE